MTWQDIAREAQEERDASIELVRPKVPDIPSPLPPNVTHIPRELLSEGEVAITELPPEQLIAQTAAGHISSQSVVNAFLRRAGLAQKLTNCIVELLPQESLERAAALDKYLAIHGRPIGPLHGLPISVKEHVGLKNRRLTGGFISWWERRGREDALILKILWRAGAIPFARTTEPQTLMHLETSSNLYGVTVNPYNRGLTSGGSSGGEGALLGLQGSCLGIGTDIGGSIRSPAANCGVFGFRPSSYRLPIGGLTAPMLWEEQIVPVIGPLSTSLEGIRLFMKTIIAGQPWLIEPSCLPIPWSDQDTQLGNPKRLKLGIMWDDGVVRPHPPVLRALEEVKERLKGYGDIQIVDWNPYRHDEAWEIIANLYLCDNGNEEREAVDSSGEPWRPLSEFIIKENPYVTHKSIEEVWHWTGKREEYRKAYTRQWNSTGTYLGDELYSTDTVDVILCPVGPGAAPLLDHAKYWSYTSQWNLLDYPAVVFPVTKVDPNIDKVDGGYKPRNEKDKFNYDLYEPEKYRGAPISLQLVGRRYQDEKVIEALQFLQSKIQLPFVKTT